MDEKEGIEHIHELHRQNTAVNVDGMPGDAVSLEQFLDGINKEYAEWKASYDVMLKQKEEIIKRMRIVKQAAEQVINAVGNTAISANAAVNVTVNDDDEEDVDFDVADDDDDEPVAEDEHNGRNSNSSSSNSSNSKDVFDKLLSAVLVIGVAVVFAAAIAGAFFGARKDVPPDKDKAVVQQTAIIDSVLSNTALTQNEKFSLAAQRLYQEYYADNGTGTQEERREQARQFALKYIPPPVNDTQQVEQLLQKVQQLESQLQEQKDNKRDTPTLTLPEEVQQDTKQDTKPAAKRPQPFFRR